MMMLRSPSIPSSSQTPLQFPSPLSRSIPTPLITLPRRYYSTITLRSLAARHSKRAKAIPSESALGGAILGTSAAQPPSAARVVIDFYEGINRRDLDFVEGLIAENCVYEDLVFSSPFVGRKAILEFFEKFTQSISSELRFVIDDISSEDSSAIGVTWHLEWKGKPFPFSKGCSFYRLEILNGKKQIVYGRDCVEPAMKPGEFALVIIRGVASLLQQFPWLADKL